MFGPDFGEGEHEFVLVVRYDSKTGEREMQGCDKNPIIAIGLLEFVLSRVRRVITQADIIQDAAQSKLALPGKWRPS